MSQPATNGAVRSDPNLTPLLDVVLQLLMFFMTCVNFVGEQMKKNVDLPVAESAVPMESSAVSVLFLNLNRNGHLEVPVSGHPEPYRTPGEIKFYVRGRYEDALSLSEDGKVKTTVIIRADRNCGYAEVYRLLKICQDVGYQKVQVRAMKSRPASQRG